MYNTDATFMPEPCITKHKSDLYSSYVLHIYKCSISASVMHILCEAIAGSCPDISFFGSMY